MTLPSSSDDKTEPLVKLVLQAVDERLSTVRDQLADLTATVATVASDGADLREQIGECRRLITAGESGSAADAGQTQLLVAANMLTERVEFLESRVNQYTNDRVAELRATVEHLLPKSPGRPAAVRPVPTALATSPRASSTVAQPNSKSPASAEAEPAEQAEQAEPVELAKSVAGGTPAPAEFDIDAFNVQLNARLSALVERAIGN